MDFLLSGTGRVLSHREILPGKSGFFFLLIEGSFKFIWAEFLLAISHISLLYGIALLDYSECFCIECRTCAWRNLGPSLRPADLTAFSCFPGQCSGPDPTVQSSALCPHTKAARRLAVGTAVHLFLSKEGDSRHFTERCTSQASSGPWCRRPLTCYF